MTTWLPEAVGQQGFSARWFDSPRQDLLRAESWRARRDARASFSFAAIACTRSWNGSTESCPVVSTTLHPPDASASATSRVRFSGTVPIATYRWSARSALASACYQRVVFRMVSQRRQQRSGRMGGAVSDWCHSPCGYRERPSSSFRESDQRVYGRRGARPVARRRASSPARRRSGRSSTADASIPNRVLRELDRAFPVGLRSGNALRYQHERCRRASRWTDSPAGPCRVESQAPFAARMSGSRGSAHHDRGRVVPAPRIQARSSRTLKESPPLLAERACAPARPARSAPARSASLPSRRARAALRCAAHHRVTGDLLPLARLR